jgi:hypothetical protein
MDEVPRGCALVLRRERWGRAPEGKKLDGVSDVSATPQFLVASLSLRLREYVGKALRRFEGPESGFGGNG